MGLFLEGLIGEVREIDKGYSDNCLGKFIRIRVMIDVEKLFRRGLRVAVGDESFSVLVCYERLPNFYYFYGKMGHLIRDCPTNNSGLLNEANLRFGAWLRAPGPKRSVTSQISRKLILNM
ncbi:hypothetical protein ACOSQ2_016635 [Xanthoceras sorbifolium]